jgi:membrane protease YdiL (CAAX protease family)
MHKPIFADTSGGFKLFLFIAITLLFALLGMFSGMLYSTLMFGVPINELGQASQSGNGLQIARSLQLFGQLGLFIFPPLFYSLLVHPRPFFFLGYSKIRSTLVALLGVLSMFIALPLINYLADFNQSIQLPEALGNIEQWMMEKEEQAALMSKAFLEVHSVSGLLANILMIAIIPAFGEEMVFRSVLQPMLIRGTRNLHLGIFLTAIIFGLMHFQFYGLLPRIVLGMILGYFYVWSGSIWVPVLMHLVNNGAAVIVYWLNYNQYIGTEMDDFGASDSTIVILFSVTLTFLACWIAFQRRGKVDRAQ